MESQNFAMVSFNYNYIRWKAKILQCWHFIENISDVYPIFNEYWYFIKSISAECNISVIFGPIIINVSNSSFLLENDAQYDARFGQKKMFGPSSGL